MLQFTDYKIMEQFFVILFLKSLFSWLSSAYCLNALMKMSFWKVYHFVSSHLGKSQDVLGFAGGL